LKVFPRVKVAARRESRQYDTVPRAWQYNYDFRLGYSLFRAAGQPHGRKDARIDPVRTRANVIVRCQNAEDAWERQAVRAVNQAAFGRPDEAALVEALHAEGAVILSLVAEMERQIAGHILFSRMWIDGSDGAVQAVALAPMAVLPAQHRRGIGGQLIRHGLDMLRGRRERIVLVLGHPNYYPRFGFSSPKAAALESPFRPQAFMALELTPGALDGVRGKVRYPAAFGL
jgi:putative acetyltransferase